ncbi:MAG: hypothetical protein AAFQ09_04670 [Pseudomonadota bacterium]
MTPDLFRRLVTKARMAPSVHNVQPARWRLAGDTVWLMEDLSVRLPAADPNGEDAAKSLGAAYEGMVMAAAEEGLGMSYDFVAHPDEGRLRPVARLSFADGSEPAPLAAYVEARQSWRGAFVDVTAADQETAARLQGVDCAVITDPDAVRIVAAELNTASFVFTARDDFRAELLSWMRLRPRHPDWQRDGLNAEAMGLGAFERLGASFVLGPLFKPLKACGLARMLLSETSNTSSASAIVVFHRPKDESGFEAGRAFYRAWLRIEAAGFGAAVLAALADHPPSAKRLAKMVGLSDTRQVVSAFRIGRRPPDAAFLPARRSVDDLIV